MTAAAEIRTGLPTDLDVLSGNNIASIGNQYVSQAIAVGQFSDAETASQALAQTTEVVRRDNKLTINMTAASLDQFLTAGQLGSYWDAQAAGVATEHVNGKAVHEYYTPMRQAADKALQRYAPADALRTSPLYAAVAGPSDASTGAAPSYGNCWIELAETVAERAVYNLSDSHASLQPAADGSYSFDESMLLNRHDAVAGKAVTELVDRYTKSLKGVSWMGSLMVLAEGEPRPPLLTVNEQSPGYVEAAIFDEVTTGEVTAIHVDTTGPQSLHELGQLMRRHPTAGISVHNSERVSPFAGDWLGRRSGNQPPELSSKLWEQLAIDPSADAATVTQALSQAASLKLRDLSRATHRTLQPGLPPMDKVAGNWHNYTMNLRESVRYRTADVKQLVEDFVELQRARLFFCEDPPVTQP